MRAAVRLVALAVASGFACAGAPTAEPGTGAADGPAAERSAEAPGAPATAGGAPEGRTAAGAPTGPGADPPPSAGVPEDAPAWLVEALAREAGPRETRAFRGPGGDFEARAPARVLEVEPPREGRTTVRLDIGAPSPVECLFFDDEVDLASTLQGVGQRVLGQETVREGRIAALDAGAVGPSATMGLDWIYRLERDGQGRIAQLKTRVATVAGRSLFCHHDELGYSATFRAMFEAVVGSLTWARPPAARAYYREVSVTVLGEQRVGVNRLALRRVEGARIVAEMRSSLLVPNGPDAVMAQDSFELQVAGADGTLERQAVADVRGGERVTALELESVGPGAWHVQGTFETKPIEAWPSAAEVPATTPVLLRAARELAAAGEVGATRRFLQWLPSADPTDFVELELELGPRVGPDRHRIAQRVSARGGAEAAAPALELEEVVDGSGSPVATRVPLGPSTLRMERVWVDGALSP